MRPTNPRTNAQVVTHRVSPLGAMVADAVSIVVFAAMGRRSHAESSALLGVLTTAWPFLAGAALGWAVLWRSGHRLAAPLSGLALVAVTVPVAMTLRWATGRGVAASFILVASVVLSLLFVGWRLLSSWWDRRSTTASSAA